MENELKIANMHSVVIDKEKLLSILRENKAAHDDILQAALVGYWETAKEKVRLKKEEFTKALDELFKDGEYQLAKYYSKLENKEPLKHEALNVKFNFRASLDIIYPEDHSKDYDRAIRMVELSVYDNVELTEAQFESYVLNNWDWKQSFLASNAGYATSAINAGEYVVSAQNMKKFARGGNVANNF
jgi:hypothetical protein